MLRIALVEYINTRPFLDGLEKHFSAEEVSLLCMPPAACGTALQKGDCDLALVPVGAIPDMPAIEILPDYCIGAEGEVASVFIFSQVPLEEAESLVLDAHSRSSNGLARILLQHHWNLNPSLLQPKSRNFGQIKGSSAGVVIGDQAIRMRGQYAYVYDLSLAWQEMTSLPFAFAVWAAPKGRLDSLWRQRLHDAFKEGVEGAAQSAARWADKFEIEADFAQQYLTSYIDFRFNAPKHQALNLYLQLLSKLAVPGQHELHYI